VDRKGVENYQLLLGGAESADTSLGTITGPGFPKTAWSMPSKR
jgi:sulfite reductase (NADPH) hemoprotein beta-component